MSINFKQPRYLVPLALVPFLCIFFYAWHSSQTVTPAAAPKPGTAMQEKIGEVSPEIRKKELSDKLDAYRNDYKEGDGYTAITPIAAEKSDGPAFKDLYNASQKRILDSIDREAKIRATGINVNQPRQVSPSPPVSAYRHIPGSSGPSDKALSDALAALNAPDKPARPKEVPADREKDPMELFKAQMAYIDSANKAADPETRAALKKQAALDKLETLRAGQQNLRVKRPGDHSAEFNTLIPGRPESPITAIVDENLTAYAGSRIRIRLLEDLLAGETLVKKGTMLYAMVSGFGDQRVSLTISSILLDGKVLPVKLDIYDTDGLKGLYVPGSAFREFTKDLGGNSIQGVNIQGDSQNQSQFLMSTFDKVFQSTSSAIADAIRKNKAKIKYNSYIYLVDTEAGQHNNPK